MTASKDPESTASRGARFERGQAALASGDFETARRILRQLALRGSAAVQFGGVPRDHAEAVRWYQMAAERGHGEAAFALGCLYIEGKRLPRDHELGTKWLRLAAEQGHELARFRLRVLGQRWRGKRRHAGSDEARA